MAQQPALPRDPSLINVTLRPITIQRGKRIDLTVCGKWQAARYPTEHVLALRHARNAGRRRETHDEDLAFRSPLSGNAADGIRP